MCKWGRKEKMFVEGRDWDWINSYPTTISGYSQRLSPCRSYQEIRECLAMDQIPFFFSFFFFFFLSLKPASRQSITICRRYTNRTIRNICRLKILMKTCWYYYLKHQICIMKRTYTPSRVCYVLRMFVRAQIVSLNFAAGFDRLFKPPESERLIVNSWQRETDRDWYICLTANPPNTRVKFSCFEVSSKMKMSERLRLNFERKVKIYIRKRISLLLFFPIFFFHFRAYLRMIVKMISRFEEKKLLV